MLTTKMKPLDCRVIVALTIEKETVSRGGIVIPSTGHSDELPQRGVVIAIGPGKYLESLGEIRSPMVAVGDQVIFALYSGISIEEDGNKLKFLRDEEILAVIGK